ncbi:MAG: glycosyltransferase [bacterium]|nr:MAG: glycosyltransferase [bacterium]
MALNIGITCYSTYGGSGIVGSELGRELAKRGHTVHFICSALPTRLTELSENILFHEVEPTHYPLFEYPPYDLALAVKMSEVATEVKLDLLHVHYAIPHSISAFLARELNSDLKYLPIVTTLHGTDITLVGADRSYLPITRFGILKSDGVTAVSSYLQQETCQVFDIGCDTISVIPNFIDPSYYFRRQNEQLRSKLAPNGEKLVVHVSNFRPVKRITDCVRIFAAIQNKVKARLIMVGDGPEKAQGEWLARQMGVSKSVCFVGKQPGIVDYLSVADLLLLTSETESFGLSALEAMACEVPVIASNVGKYAIKILSSDNLQRKMGQFARQIAIEKFSTEKIMPLYLSYYDRILEKAKNKTT